MTLYNAPSKGQQGQKKALTSGYDRFGDWKGLGSEEELWPPAAPAREGKGCRGPPFCWWSQEDGPAPRSGAAPPPCLVWGPVLPWGADH